MPLHRTTRLAVGFAALSVLASGCLILNSEGGGTSHTREDVSYGGWRSTTVKADAPGLPDAVQDSFTAPGTKGRYYVVKKGDSLAAISRHFYGDTKFWKSIHNANRRVIADPDSLEPGVSLRIP